MKIQNTLILIMFNVEFNFFSIQTTKSKCFVGQLQHIFNYIRIGCILNNILKVAGYQQVTQYIQLNSHVLIISSIK